MRRFLIGSIVGALLMYAVIHMVPGWTQSGGQWIDEAASGYRGDQHRQRADEILR